jgi:hypothetical protein
MKKMKNIKVFMVLSIIAMIAFAGCTGKNEQTSNTPQGDVKTSGEEGNGNINQGINTGNEKTTTQNSPVPLAENVSPKGDYAALHIKEIEDIDNGTYFEITDDELKEHPEINKSIRGGEGCTKFDSGGWYCELNSYEVDRYSDFMNRKVYKAGYIEYQFIKIGEYYYEIQLVVS